MRELIEIIKYLAYHYGRLIKCIVRDFILPVRPR